MAERICFECGGPIKGEPFWVDDFPSRNNPREIHRGGYAQRPHCEDCARLRYSRHETEP